MSIAQGDWKIEGEIPYPLFAGTKKAVFVVDAKGHPIALVDSGIANLAKAAPKMAEALEDIIAQAAKTRLMMGVDLADSIKVFGKQALAEAKGGGG